MSETQAESHASKAEESSSGKTLADDDDQVQEEIDALIEDPPDKLEDWPDGKAKYKTIGGGEGDNDAYGEGATKNLGPADLVHHEDGSVSIGGEKVDNPEDYKNEETIEIDMKGAPEEIVEGDDSTSDESAEESDESANR